MSSAIACEEGCVSEKVSQPFDVGSFFDTTVGRIAALAGAITGVAAVLGLVIAWVRSHARRKDTVPGK